MRTTRIATTIHTKKTTTFASRRQRARPSRLGAKISSPVALSGRQPKSAVNTGVAVKSRIPADTFTVTAAAERIETRVSRFEGNSEDSARFWNAVKLGDRQISVCDSGAGDIFAD
ncbi:unnamed protein product [Heterotrigona itama]|uniref:Uncharacterized protein n=1 Tax=Heterotrigona itama TaxID=395501 RepID=A0A6V7HCQ9_9HYME|nr:unnamed protein product [Heterotrigona itama]